MTQTYPDYIWHNGEIKRWQDATVHVMAHGLHYGSSVFEGIRCYETHNGHAIFRLNDHNKRLYDSAKIYEMPIPYTLDQINTACHQVIKANGLGNAYLRPIAFRDLGGLAYRPIALPACRWQPGIWVPTSVMACSKPVLMPVFRAGSAWHPTRFLPAQKPAAIICPAN